MRRPVKDPGAEADRVALHVGEPVPAGGEELEERPGEATTVTPGRPLRSGPRLGALQPLGQETGLSPFELAHGQGEREGGGVEGCDEHVRWA